MTPLRAVNASMLVVHGTCRAHMSRMKVIMEAVLECQHMSDVLCLHYILDEVSVWG